MSPTREPPTPDRSYEAIEAAVAETARGRWFLAEHARRTRAAGTRSLLDAISRLERAMSARKASVDPERLRPDLAIMTAAIARSRAEIGGLATGRDGAGTPKEAAAMLNAVVQAASDATADILNATEKVQEAAWTMREAGFDPALCDALDRRAGEIHAACTRRNLATLRVRQVARLLADLDDRIANLNRRWGEPADSPRLDERVAVEPGRRLGSAGPAPAAQALGDAAPAPCSCRGPIVARPAPERPFSLAAIAARLRALDLRDGSPG